MPDKAARLMPFSFRRLGGKAAAAGETGRLAFLSAAELASLGRGRLSGPLRKKLAAAWLLSDRLDLEAFTGALAAGYLSGWRGPSVHIVTLTGRCDHGCLYCSASAGPRGGDMSRASASAVLDFAFGASPGGLVLEFQGGEPLLNFGTLKFMVRRASARAAAEGRNIHFSVVTNLSPMTEDIFRFLRDNRVTVCASLDGPAALHDLNRPRAGGGSHSAAARWLKRLAAEARRDTSAEPPNAICTVTRASLSRPEAVVDEFLRLGLRRVQLGPLDPIGRAAERWNELGYEPGEFLSFYSRALDRMLRLNRRGLRVYEKGAALFLRGMLGLGRPRYQNLDIFCRLAYGPDGSVYGSDEARMLAASGDDFFRLGRAGRDTFRSVLAGPLARPLMMSAFPGLTQSSCARCPYSAWCRVAPAHNWAAQGSFWGDMASSRRCALFKGVCDLLCRKLGDPSDGGILRAWAEEEK